MSSLTNAIIAEISASLNGTYLATAVLALFLYDFLLTMPLEVSCIWGKKFRLSTLYYIAMRYLPMAQLLFGVAANATTPHCDSIMKFIGVLGVVARAGIVATLASRTWVFCTFRRDYIIMIGIGFLGAATIIVEFAQIFTFTCHARVDKEKTMPWYNAAVIPRLLFEVVVVFVTIYRTLPTVKLQTGLKQFGGKSLMFLILKSEIIYFVAILAVEITSAICFYAAAPGVIITGTLSTPLSAILISRFILDLRETNLLDTSDSLSNTIPMLYPLSRHSVGPDHPDAIPSLGYEIGSSQLVDPGLTWNMASKVEQGLSNSSQHVSVPIWHS